MSKKTKHKEKKKARKLQKELVGNAFADGGKNLVSLCIFNKDIPKKSLNMLPKSWMRKSKVKSQKFPL